MDPRELGLSADDLEALGYVRREGPEEPSGTDGAERQAVRVPPETSPSAAAARRWLWTAVLLLGAGWGASSYRQLPDPVPANRPDTVFSSGRALSQLVEIARAPRPPGSPEHERVRVFLEDRLRALGLEPEVQVATASTMAAGSADVLTVRNVLVRLSGAASSGAVLLTAHYDSAPLSPGAGDDGVGIAAILETLRVIGSSAPLQNDVIVLFTDGEVLGSMGARAFAEEHPWASEVGFAVSLDIRGVAGPAWVVESETHNARVIRGLASAVRRPVAHSLAQDVGGELDRMTGLSVLREYGTPAIGLLSLGGQESHHGALDTAERVNERTLAHYGQQLVALTRWLGNQDLSVPSGTAEDSVAYFSLPVIGLVSYPAGWSLFVTIGLWLAWLSLVLIFRLRGGEPRRALAGTAMAAAAIGSAAGAGELMVRFLRSVHPEYGRLSGAVFNDGMHMAALAAISIGFVVLVYGVARRRFERAELHLGAMLLPLGFLVWLTLDSPLAAPALQVPLVIALVFGAVVVFAEDRLGSKWAWVGSLVLCACALSVIVPSAEWVIATLTPRRSVTIGAVLALSALLVLPIGDWLIVPRLWWTPALAVIGGVAMAVLAMPWVQGEERHPELTSLILLVDDTMSATPSAVAPDGGDPAELADSLGVITPRRALGVWLTVEGPGEEWARSWAVPGGVGERGPDGLLLPDGVPWVVAGAGPGAELSPSRVEIIESTVVEGRWRVRVEVTPGLDGEMVGLRLAEGVPGDIVAVDGLTLTSQDGSLPLRSVRRWGTAGNATFELRLDAAPDSAFFDLLEHHLRPTELLGEMFFERDGTLIPDASTGSDRLVQRTRVRISRSEGSG